MWLLRAEGEGGGAVTAHGDRAFMRGGSENVLKLMCNGYTTM